MLKMWFYLTVALLYSFTKTVSVPIIETFVDNWDFQIVPHHKEPLLNKTGRNHVLPPVARRRAKEEILDALGNDPDLMLDMIGMDTKKKIGDSVRVRVSCAACKIGVGLLQGEVKKGNSFDEIKAKFVSLCVTFDIETEKVCSGIFDVFGRDVLPVLNMTKIGPKEICSLCLGEPCGDTPNPLHEWDVIFPDIPKPEVKQLLPPKDDVPVFKVLHLSDTHFDPEYQEGTPENCQEPLCCRPYSTPSKKHPLKLSGKWGSYERCDSPKALIDNMLQHIAEQHPDIDYIIWTGDLPPHDIWNQTKTENLDILKKTVQQIVNNFPNVPVFPALGNHEAIPTGNFPPSWLKDEDYSVSWLYNEVASEWHKWLPPSVNETLLQGGFYSVLIRPGFRLISLNMNYCHSISWWLLVNSTDPSKELQWLIYELQEAENNGEKVHIIGHIPPGAADCMKVWSRNYYSIIDRYEDTIMAQFFGHTHADEFEVFYDVVELKRPLNIAYLGPSVTTYENYNPAYRIYYVDGDHPQTTREVIDHETWTMDLEKANKNGNPEWYRLYSARDAYGMPTLRPKDWDEVLFRLILDDKLFELFHKFYYRDSAVRPSYDSQTRLQMLCDLRSGRSQDRHHICHDLEEVFRV